MQQPERVVSRVIARARPPSQAPEPLDEESQGLVDALVEAMTSDLTREELEQAERDIARSDRAYERLDALISAARRGALNLDEVEDRDGRHTFLVTIIGEGTDPFGKPVAKLLLGDETEGDA